MRNKIVSLVSSTILRRGKMKILSLLAFLPFCFSNDLTIETNNQELVQVEDTLKIVIINDQIKKELISQVKTELKEEMRVEVKAELKSEIKEELVEELTTEVISNENRIMNGPVIERDNCNAVKFLSLSRLQFDMVYENNKDCYSEIIFEKEIELKLFILNFKVSTE